MDSICQGGYFSTFNVTIIKITRSDLNNSTPTHFYNAVLVPTWKKGISAKQNN